MAEFRRLASSYEIDSPIEFGMSGGPIVAAESGRAFALAVSTEATSVPQDHLKALGRPRIAMRSSFGNGTSLASKPIVDAFRKHGITMSDV
jgi:hypothetical protein